MDGTADEFLGPSVPVDRNLRKMVVVLQELFDVLLDAVDLVDPDGLYDGLKVCAGSAAWSGPFWPCVCVCRSVVRS
jgi:hypothetical protein